MQQSIYQASEKHPYHLSVGAVLLNNENKIALHYFKELDTLGDFYLLMRETLENNETLEEAVHRGLMEEFGAKATILGYIGSWVAWVPHSYYGGWPMEKTMPYFAARLVEQRDEWRDANDPEAISTITWLSAEEAMPILEAQRGRFGRVDLDESEMVKRAMDFVKHE